MIFIRNVAFLLTFLFLAVTGISAQGKVEGNALRIKGGLFYGGVKTDFEKRNQTSDIFSSAEVNQDWKNHRDLDLINGLGVDYFHSLNSGVLSNFFIGIQLNRYGRSYQWDSFYPFGIGKKEGDYSLNYTDINAGVTLAVAPGFRILPKYVIRSLSQQLDGQYFGLGNPSKYGSQTRTAGGLSGLLGVGFEYDISESITLFADLLVYGPFLFRSKGEYNNEKFEIGNGFATFSTANGGYTFSSQKISLGGSFVLMPGLRLNASLEQERLHLKAESPFALSVTTVGFNTLGTLGEYVSATSEDRIKISGIKMGVSYDLDFK
ncbi:hypothetical protein [Leptospira idonii]|uniref:Uncharacterized protein n=1 Tax=Leptospira idonii TaxID=1193500 RepID=A0A4R9M4K8_9LEPT|nr:hypothetical protein [Leptospira idonii]TGN20775.1 hypothetical protein EHS15_02650 [Leptospira idonii]